MSADNNQIWNLNRKITNKQMINDKTWRHIYEPEPKTSNWQWWKLHLTMRKIINIQTHTWKIMVTVSYFPYLCESILGPCPRDTAE